MNYRPSTIPSTAELKLVAIMRRDAEVLRARDSGDDEPRQLSAESRAKIAASMRGNSNRKSKPAAVPPDAKPRRQAKC